MLPLNGGALTVSVHIADTLSVTKGIEFHVLQTQPLLELYERSFGHVEDETERRRLVVEHINLAVMGRIVEVKPDLLLVMALSPISPWLIDNSKNLGVMTAHWYLEDFRYSPINPLIPRWQTIAPSYDHFFTIQKGAFFDALRDKGVRNYHYLPTACNPRIHHRVDKWNTRDNRCTSDICFVGAVYPNRVALFKELKGFDFSLWGPGWAEITELKPCAKGSGAWVTSIEENKILNEARIGLNIHSSLDSRILVQKGDFLNPRVFTIAACGTFQLVDEQGPLQEVFQDGYEVVTYGDLETLIAKARYYLEDPGERERIASRAQERVLEEHTYMHRIQEMLRIMSLN